MLRPGLLSFVAVSVLAAFAGSTDPVAAGAWDVDAPTGPYLTAHSGDWLWPVEHFRLVMPYRQPAHRYGAGHRGLDLEPLGDAAVRTPASGVVAFAGSVADRAIVTIDHGQGLVTTLEPVTAAVAVGVFVAGGEVVGDLALGGHAAPGTVHFGVRRDGEYINPLLLLGGVPRAVLLPCCE